MDLDGRWFACACACGSERHLLDECAAQCRAAQGVMATGAGLATTTILFTPDETEPESEAAWCGCGWGVAGGRGVSAQTAAALRAGMLSRQRVCRDGYHESFPTYPSSRIPTVQLGPLSSSIAAF